MLGLGLIPVIPALADSNTNSIASVQITPANTTLPIGGTQQFSAQAYDANDDLVTNVTYFWLVANSGGTIRTSGIFTAGSVVGTYANTVEVVAVQGSLSKIAYATVTVTGTVGTLNHVTITPASATVGSGETQQFTAQGYDANNFAITGLTYKWEVVNGGGTIDNNGLFTAGSTTGTFANTIRVTVTQGSNSVINYAAVVVTAAPATITTPAPNLNLKGLLKLFSGVVTNTGFANFLGGQWQVKNGSTIETIQVIPGVVQSASSLSLTIMPNGQNAAVTYALASNTSIYPKDTQFAAGDDVVVVTDNGQVSLVAKVIAPSSTGNLPPGLRKHKANGNVWEINPPGWSHGKKVGWND